LVSSNQLKERTMLKIELQHFHQVLATAFLLLWCLIGAVINSDSSELPPLDMRLWPVDKLIPYPHNPRKNNHLVNRMIAAIREFRLILPLLIRSAGEVVDGHLRLKAAIKLGFREIPVIIVDHWSPEQVEAGRLLFNRSASWATWDTEGVATIINELAKLNFDLSLTGFEGFEIDRFLLDSSGIDGRANSLLDPSLHPVTFPGDLWHCGAHRVLCGDATSAEAVSRVLESDKPLLMVTDAPYAVNYNPLWREQAGLGRARQKDKVTNDDRVDWTQAYQLFPGDVAYIWHAGVHSGEVARSLEGAGWEIRSQIIWFKSHFVLSRGDYHWAHEPCYYAVRRGKTSRWRGDRKQSTVWQVPNLNPFGGDRAEMPSGHGTQKPVELVRRSILNHLERGEALYDGFLGSGTCLLGAQLTGRICYGLEIEPRFVDMTLRRWQDMTGEKALLDGDGRTFEEIQAARQASPEVNVEVAPTKET
jgi:DNA modification methylase